MSNLVIGRIASLGAGLATFIGALPILLPIHLTQRVQDVMIGFVVMMFLVGAGSRFFCIFY